jgi:predicted HNH restriction endonuclease
MLHDPANHIFIKPGPTASFLKSIGSPLTWQPHTTAAFYTQFQALAKAILPHLSPLGAQDMIDVQSFIWILRPLSEKEKSSRLNQIVKDDLKAVEEENSDPTSPGFPEGQKTTTLVSKYERDARNRAAAIQIHGTTCQACGFNFQQFYGSHGQDYIEVHHLQPLASYKSSIKIDPATDLAVLCANCHRMIHRHPQSPLTLEQLRHLISQAKAQP